MALRSRAVVAATKLAERLRGALGRSTSASASASDGRLRALSTWQPPMPATYYNHPGFWSSVDPGTYQRDQRTRLFPWSLEGMNAEHLLRFSNAQSLESSDDDKDQVTRAIGVPEARKIVMNVNAVSLHKRLKADPRDSISLGALLDLIKESGVVVTDEEASRYAGSLNEAGVVLIFRENVYLHPERVAKLISHALPFAVVPLDDPRRAELIKLEEEKAKIDALANKHVKRFLLGGLVVLTCQSAVLLRLTYWELSWDVIEPVAFFLTSAGLLMGYTYFLVTSTDPSYQDLRRRLFYSRQLKLFKKKHFDYFRYQLLKRQCQCVDPDDRRW